MRKIGFLFGIVVMAVTVGCVAPERQYGYIQSRGGVNDNATADSSEVEKSRIGKKMLYVAGIDKENDEIVLYADGEEILRFPFGDEYEVSGDPDMHHIIEGRLYSEYISDRETILKRDGKELVRYRGREIIKGIYPDGPNIYTLGQKCDGEGFSYRRNGKAIMTKDRGQILGSMYDVSYMYYGALYKDVGSICFCYFKSANGGSSRNGVTEWHLVKDGNDNLLTLDKASTEIYDLRLANGTVCYVSCDNYSSVPVLHVGDQAFDFNASKYTPGRDYRLCTSEGGIRFSGSYTYGKDKSKTFCISLNGLEYSMDGSGYTVYENAGEYAWVQYFPQQITIFTPTSKEKVLSGKYEYISCWDADFSGGEFKIAVTPCDRNQKPFVWIEGEKQEYKLRGQIIGICFY